MSIYRWPTVRYKHGRMKQKLIMTSACFRRLDVVAHRWGGPGTVVPVRFDADTLKALSQRAHDEGLTTRSDAIRAAVNQWLGLGS